MFDLSWSELLLVGAIALVVIGPRELPRVLRTVGQTLSKMRRMAGDFQQQFSAAMREAELDELRSTASDVKSAADRALGTGSGGAFDPLRTVRDELRDAIQKPAAQKHAEDQTQSLAASSVVSPPDGLAQEQSFNLSSPAPLPVPAPPSWEDDRHTPFDASGSDGGAAVGKRADLKQAGEKRGGARRGRVIVAAPRDVVKPLFRPARGTQRLYKKVRFSAFPARQRPGRDGEGKP